MKHGCAFEDRNGPVAAAEMAIPTANNAAIWVRFMTPFYGAAERRNSCVTLLMRAYLFIKIALLRRAANFVGERAIGQSLRQVHAPDLFGTVEIGQRAGDTQYAMVAARRQAHAAGGVAQ